MRDARAGDREEGEAERIGDRQRMVGRTTEPCVEEGDRRRDHARDDMPRIFDPEHRMSVEQQVANRAAADGGDDGDDEDAQHVHPPSSGGERAAGREYRLTHQLKHVEHAGLTTHGRSPDMLK